MRYIDFSEIPQDLKSEILNQVFTHDLIVEKLKQRILYLLNTLELKNPICEVCFMDYYRWIFMCYKLLVLILHHSVDLITEEPLKDDDLREFLKNVDLRMDSLLEKMK